MPLNVMKDFPCALCGNNVSRALAVMWCDDCMTEFENSDERMSTFTDRKRAERGKSSSTKQ